MSHTPSKQSKDPDHKTSNELYHEESKKFLADKQIEIGSKKIEKIERGSPVTNAQKILVRTNMYTITAKKKVSIYKYNVKIAGRLRELEPIEFTKSSSSELFGVDRMNVCSKVFDALFDREPGVFASREKFYYNLCAVLYSVEKIEDYYGEFSTEELFVGEQDIDFLAKLCGREKFEVDIKLEQTIDNTDLASLMARMSIDQDEIEAVRFSEVATWQNAIQSPEHIIFPRGRSYLNTPVNHGYHENDLDIDRYGNDIYLGIGLSKSSKLIEGKNGEEGLAIVVEPKVNLFHHAMSLVDKFRLNNESQYRVDSIRDVVRGLYFISSHLIRNLNRVRVFRIHDVGEPANVQTFEFNGEAVTVAEYFSRQDFPLLCPNLPVMVVRQRGGLSYYPMEHCVLVDNQRVAPMSPDLISRFIRNAAVTPFILQKRIEISRNVLFLENSDFMANAGIEVSQRPITVQVPILAAPQMKYGTFPANFDGVRSDWKGDKARFDLPSAFGGCCAFVAVDRGARFSKDNFRQFLDAFQRECTRRGINAPITEDQTIILEPQNLYENLHNAMKYAGENDYKFALVITNVSDTRIHLDLKAYEQKFGVITQNVTHKTALATIGVGVDRAKVLSLGNIVNKTNMKLGGLNYEVVNGRKALGVDDLFLGFALNHLAAGMGNLRETVVPSILGYAANDLASSIAFTGDFIYNKPSHQGFLPSIFDAACKVFTRFLVNRKNAEPKRVIVYRGGCSDGEFGYIMQYEVPTLRKAIKNVFKSGPKLVVITVNKLHNVRFTYDNIPNGNQNKAKDQNIPAGVVIDSSVVRPTPEFYLASHRALQGTAKIPRYNVLYDEAGSTLSELEKTTYDLSFCHQIITSPVSIPSPLYCAMENAKRGRNLYNSGVNADFVAGSRRDFGLEGGIDHDDEEVRRLKQEHAAALTENLSYARWPEIREKRFNA